MYVTANGKLIFIAKSKKITVTTICCVFREFLVRSQATFWAEKDGRQRELSFLIYAVVASEE